VQTLVPVGRSNVRCVCCCAKVGRHHMYYSILNMTDAVG
jgi:hypothetical protein